MTSQIPIVNYNTSANTGQALPSWPSLLHLLPVCLVSVRSECQALSFPSTAIHAGLNTPAEDHSPHQEGNQEEPHSAAALVEDWGLPPTGLASGKWEPLCSHHHPRWERRALFSTLSPAGAALSSAAGMGLARASTGTSSFLQLLQPGCPRLGHLLSSSCVAATDLLKESHQGGNFPSKHP